MRKPNLTLSVGEWAEVAAGRATNHDYTISGEVWEHNGNLLIGTHYIVIEGWGLADDIYHITEVRVK